jgi:adenine specific DNA methylase Mod
MAENLLYYGNNLEVLKRHVADESVDLVYLDPPFNSSQGYNVLFAERDGTQAAAQIKAFEDTWRWDLGGESGCADGLAWSLSPNLDWAANDRAT